ncbi:MAG: hypothetical protein HUU46_19215 [Candidatus Hydrogenedentes bacterium]|nr:hypothetical protein [Candidatus Hydrogenedentota bacterium]
MNNTLSHSPTCPVCGAARIAAIENVPVRGRISVERRYACGRRVQCTYALVEMRVQPECGAPHDSNDRQSKEASSQDW